MKLYKVIAMSLVFLTFAAPAVASAKTTSTSTTQSASSKTATAVNINTADTAVLAKLKGVGKKKAAAIVAYRKAHGNFASVSDLKNVKGMSQRIINMNKDVLQVSGN